jgi:hypothetical protein
VNSLKFTKIDPSTGYALLIFLLLLIFFFTHSQAGEANLQPRNPSGRYADVSQQQPHSGRYGDVEVELP